MSPGQRPESPYRILIGPLYHPGILGPWLGDPNILSFGFNSEVRVTEMHNASALAPDLHYDPMRSSFAELLATLPPGWEPDLVVWYNVTLLGIPPGLADCPWPTVGVIYDWTLNLQACLDYAQAFDFIVADRAFLEILARQGYSRCAYWPCYGYDPTQHYLIPGLERIYDVAFLGNMGYHYHRRRNLWLTRLARLGDKHRILISDRYYRDDYTRVLNQSKIAFNFSLRGEMNLRSYEAAACGALVLGESSNREMRDFLVDGESCVLYDEHNLESLIDYYLSHDAERQRVAANGARAIAAHDYGHQFARLIELVPTIRAAFAASGRQAFHNTPPLWRTLLEARQWSQSLIPGSTEHAVELLMAQARSPEPLEPAWRAHLEAVAAALELNRHCKAHHLIEPGVAPPEALQALSQLEQALPRLQRPFWHAYNLACANTLMRRPVQAIALWQHLLPQLATVPIELAEFSWMELLPHGHGREFHVFHALWGETAGEFMAGRASSEDLRRLLLWQAHELCGHCLMWLNQPEAAIQLLLQSEALGPGSYYTYATLLQLLFRAGREAELLACLERAVAQLGLIESLQRDLILTLVRQQRWEQLKPVLHFYRLLMSCFEGGSTQARESMLGWIPNLIGWLPELIEVAIEAAGKK